MNDPLGSHGASKLEQSRAVNQQLELQRLRERLDSNRSEKKDLREACMQFEAVFIQRMWEQMRATVPKEGYLHSKEQDMYMSMFDREMSMEMAQAGGIGLADLLYGQLKQRLEQSGVEAASVSLQNPANFEDGKKLPGQFQSDSNSERKLDSREINRILAMNIPPEKRVDFLASQIEYSLGGKPVNDLPELEQKVDKIESVPVEESQGLPPLHWPVSGTVSSGFGWREDPFTGRQAWHAGLDFAVPQGTPVEACWPGEVIFSDLHQGFGNKVIIQHSDGWKSVYAHNSHNLVQVGDRVESGQVIASSGSTGRSTGPHLHFELRQGDLAWNPKMIRERLLAGLSIGRGIQEDTT